MGVLDQAQQGAVTPQLAEAAAQAGAPGPAAAAPAGPSLEAAPAAPPPGAAPPPSPEAAPAGPPQDAVPSPGQGGFEGLPLKQADPQTQQEYERAMRAVTRVLYGNDKTANGIVDQIDPNDLVGSTSKVTMLFIKELDRKINMDEGVIAEIMQETVGRIAELAEARHGVNYEQTDLEKIIGASWEGVQTMYGNDDVEGYTQTVQSLAPETYSALQQRHSQILNSAKG